MTRLTGPVSTLAALVLATVLTSCSWFDGDDNGPKSQSVFRVQKGECFTAPDKVHAELSSLDKTPCTSKHALEAYAIVPFTDPQATTSDNYPGSNVLTKFANGECAQRFSEYVGIDYLDSELFFTYLLPSPRSWQQGLDRNVICFVESVTQLRTSSAKGSKD